MEEALGAALLVRGRQGVTPTQAGRTLLQHARTILRQAERLREDLGAYAGGLAGQIRVLSNTNALTEFLPEALSSFLAAHPQCQRRPRGAAERRDRRPDRRRASPTSASSPAPSMPSALETYPFRNDRFVLVVAARPSARASVRRSPSREVLDHDFVGLDRASALQRFLADKAARIGQPLRLRVQLRSFDAVCRLVECKVGIGIVPETTARRVDEDHGDRRRSALTDPWAVRELTICVRELRRAAALRAPAGRAPAPGGGAEERVANGSSE